MAKLEVLIGPENSGKIQVFGVGVFISLDRYAAIRAERDALRKAIIEYDDCDTASQSKRACKAMVDLAKGVK